MMSQFIEEYAVELSLSTAQKQHILLTSGPNLHDGLVFHLVDALIQRISWKLSLLL